MNKLFFVFLFCSVGVTDTKAQALMTVADVYNFNIGDIFVTQSGGVDTPPNYTRKTITNKYYDPTGDTLYYVYDQNSYQLCYPPPCTGLTTSYVDLVVSYTNLDDTLGAGLGVPPTSPCIDTAGFTGTWLYGNYYDTLYCNTLKTSILQMQGMPDLFDSCWYYFEPIWNLYAYGKGLGEIEHRYFDCTTDPDCGWRTFLVYYNKGIDSCGTMPQMADVNIGLLEFNTNNRISIYPNPGNDVLNLEYPVRSNPVQVQISDGLGKVVLQKQLTSSLGQFSVGHLAPGIHSIRVTDQHNVRTTKWIKQ